MRILGLVGISSLLLYGCATKVEVKKPYTLPPLPQFAMQSKEAMYILPEVYTTYATGDPSKETTVTISYTNTTPQFYSWTGIECSTNMISWNILYEVPITNYVIKTFTFTNIPIQFFRAYSK